MVDSAFGGWDAHQQDSIVPIFEATHVFKGYHLDTLARSQQHDSHTLCYKLRLRSSLDCLIYLQRAHREVWPVHLATSLTFTALLMTLRLTLQPKPQQIASQRRYSHLTISHILPTAIQTFRRKSSKRRTFPTYIKPLTAMAPFDRALVRQFHHRGPIISHIRTAIKTRSFLPAARASYRSTNNYERDCTLLRSSIFQHQSIRALLGAFFPSSEHSLVSERHGLERHSLPGNYEDVLIPHGHVPWLILLSSGLPKEKCVKLATDIEDYINEVSNIKGKDRSIMASPS